MRRSRRSPVAIVLLLVALGAAACSSDGDDEAADATGVSASTGPPSVTASAVVSGKATGTTAATGSSAPTGPTPATATGAVDQPTPVEPDPDNAACQLLTEDVAEPIIGVDLSVAGDVSIGNHSTCVLRDADETVSVDLRITLGRDAQREYDELYASVEGARGVRLVDGLGEQAFQAVATNDAHILVMTDDTLVRLSTASEGPALGRETLELARAIVSNV
jgi:hypothetical protein